MNKELNLPRLFLIYSLIFGSLLVFLVPSFQSPDEITHFTLSYNLSAGKLNSTVKDKKSGYNLPNDMISEINKMEKMYSDRDKKYSYSEMYFDQLLSSNLNDKSFFGASISTISIFAYIVPAIGIQITDYLEPYATSGISHVKTNVMIQFARFLSLIIYSLIGYFAIRITPKFKKSFFVILLLPLSLFLRSMVTYDGLVLSVTALSIALILKLIDDKTIKWNKKYLFGFIILGYILFNIKVIYSICFLGLFVVDSKQFGGKKEKIKNAIIMISTILILTYIKKHFILPSAGLESSKLTAKQLNFIINNPILYIKILFDNIIGQIKQQNYWMMGTLGHLDTYMPYLFVFVMNIFLFITLLVDSFYEKIILPAWLKISYVILSILAVAGMYTIMYISWTPKVLGKIGGNEITGIQGRYFIPLLLLIPIIFSNNLIDKLDSKKNIKKILEKIKNVFDNNFYHVTLGSLILTVIIIFLRFYV